MGTAALDGIYITSSDLNSFAKVIFPCFERISNPTEVLGFNKVRITQQKANTQRKTVSVEEINSLQDGRPEIHAQFPQLGPMASYAPPV